MKSSLVWRLERGIRELCWQCVNEARRVMNPTTYDMPANFHAGGLWRDFMTLESFLESKTGRS